MSLFRAQSPSYMSRLTCSMRDPCFIFIDTNTPALVRPPPLPHLILCLPRPILSALFAGRLYSMQCLHVNSDLEQGPGPPTGVTRLGSPASPRIVPVHAAACRAYRDPGARNHVQVLSAPLTKARRRRQATGMQPRNRPFCHPQPRLGIECRSSSCIPKIILSLWQCYQRDTQLSITQQPGRVWQ